MNIAWLTWKDHKHPEAGGSEVVTRELTKRLLVDGHSVTMVTARYPNSPEREDLDGVEVIRVGNSRYTHTFAALQYYLKHMRDKFDLLVEEINTSPYFSVLFEKKAKKFLLYHHVQGKVWHYQTPPVVSHLGQHVLEPIANRIVAAAKAPVMTVSESTKGDLARHGHHPSRIHILSEGIEIKPVADLDKAKKYAHPTLLCLGAMRAMKRALDQIQAFELAKKEIPDLQLKVVGNSAGAYGKKVLDHIAASPYASDIEYLGHVSRADKARLMQKSHIIMQTAVKEGWGLTVTEAASQGTPAVVYNVHGLRDSVRHGQTGIVTAENPQALADGIVQLLGDQKQYNAIRTAAWDWSKQINFEQSYRDFKKVVGLAV